MGWGCQFEIFGPASEAIQQSKQVIEIGFEFLRSGTSAFLLNLRPGLHPAPPRQREFPAQPTLRTITERQST